MSSLRQNYSLWLMPQGDARARLAEIIGRFSTRFAAPTFLPHVTLLGSCMGERREMIRWAARVAEALRPFTVRLQDLDRRDQYYRALFVHAALTEPLRKAHAAACEATGRKHEPAFMPHLSLLYGDFPTSLKEHLIAEIGPRLDVQFPVRSLFLFLTHGDPSRWRQVARFGLK